MSSEKITLKDFMKGKPIVEKKRAKKLKKPKNRKTKYNKSVYNPGGLANAWFTSNLNGATSNSGSFGGSDAGGIGESLIMELLAGITPSAFSANVNSATAYGVSTKDAGMTTFPSEDEDPDEEEVEMKAAKVDQARQLFQAMFNRPNASRADIINSFMKDVNVTNSTAVSYYTRFLDEFGVSSKEGPESLGHGTGMGRGDDITSAPAPEKKYGEVPVVDIEQQEEPIDPDRAGIIRTVPNAHLVYKRQQPEGTFEELWIYNIHDTVNDELIIRRAILAGTDIPVKKTTSADGTQSYTINTMGNAQLLKLGGLQN